MPALDRSFYLSDDTLFVARQLIGKVIFTNIKGEKTGGIIIETEAYLGIEDRASHAYNNRRTARTEIMYSEGGNSYVYLCYGIHFLFNVVTGSLNKPNAVLIRGILPYTGLALMSDRRNQKYTASQIIGPGNVTKSLGITLSHNGMSLQGKEIWIEDIGIIYQDEMVSTSPRIGVDYAGSDALLPYRYHLSTSSRHPS